MIISIGLNINELLTPETIPGIKKYLGVGDGDNLIHAVAQDQYAKVERLLARNGYVINNAAFEPVDSLSSNQDIDDISNGHKIGEIPDVKRPGEKESRVVNEDKSTPVTPEQPTIDGLPDNYKPELNWFIVDTLIALQREQHGEITNVVIGEQYKDQIMKPSSLLPAAELDDDMDISFEAVDDDTVMSVSYLDEKKKMQFKVVTTKDMEDRKNAK